MVSLSFCPQCGTKAVENAKFCTNCGVSFTHQRSESGSDDLKPPQSVSDNSARRLSVTGICILCSYLLLGTAVWVFILRTHPFSPSKAKEQVADNVASTGGSLLANTGAPINLPEEVTARIKDLAREATEQPNNPTAWLSLADVQFRASQFDSSYRSAALASYRRLHALQPKNPAGLRGLGNVYYDLQEHAQAIEYYQLYLEVDPKDPSVMTDLGTMYLYTGRTVEAIDTYQAALGEDANFFQAHFNLGIAYQARAEDLDEDEEKRGMIAEATASLTRAKELTESEDIRARIDQLMGTPLNQDRPGKSSAVKVADGGFRQTVEMLFRSHEMMAPKIINIWWPSDTRARISLENFPMARMPQSVRDGFVKKLTLQISMAQKENHVGGQVTVELVDGQTQSVMQTIETPPL